MSDEYILVKNKMFYTLSQYWIDTILHYADLLGQQAHHGHININIIPWYYKTISAGSIAELDTARFDIVTTIIRLTSITPKTIFTYSSHNYRGVGYAQETIDFYTHLHKLWRSCSVVFGSQSVLDLYGRILCHPTGYTDSYLSHPLVPLTGYSVTIIGSMMIETYIDTTHIDTFFDQTTDISQFDITSFRQLFTVKSQTKCVIKYDEQQTQYRRARRKKEMR